MDLFSSLQPSERKHLAQRLDFTPFERGALMTRQGDDADCLYLMVDGHADVLIDAPDGGMAMVAEVGPGSFFGEMGLMTGEPRSATVVARSKVDAFRLDKDAFEEVLRARPAIAEEICQILARRRTELDQTREALDSEAEARRLAKAHGDLLARIQKFFALN
jgi:CRP-like cAMP-binding protein